ncbi:MAG TPA: hypothetical protein VK723_03870, partial [Thermoplasmata archaeon]|nr:hypothetical protein [Thermoplasmata archaeon]
SSLPLFKHSRVFVAALFAYAAYIVALALIPGWPHLGMALALPAVVYGVWEIALKTFEHPVRHTNYGVVGTIASKGEIHSLVSGIVVGALASAGAVAAIWQFWWPATLVVLYAYFLFVVFSMKATYRSIVLGKGRRTEPLFLGKMKPLRNAWAPRVANGRK